jgi:hypothetical protein
MSSSSRKGGFRGYKVAQTAHCRTNHAVTSYFTLAVTHSDPSHKAKQSRPQSIFECLYSSNSDCLLSVQGVVRSLQPARDNNSITTASERQTPFAPSPPRLQTRRIFWYSGKNYKRNRTYKRKKSHEPQNDAQVVSSLSITSATPPSPASKEATQSRFGPSPFLIANLSCRRKEEGLRSDDMCI